MARGRDIKPGFFLSEELAEVSRDARLLFIGLWTLADREGRLEYRPMRIRAQLFPYDLDITPDKVGHLVDELELANGKFIRRYIVNGEVYMEIKNFTKHQHVHPKEKASEIPPNPESGNAQTDPRDGTRKTYFIRRGNDGPIKIGRTSWIESRLSSIQNGSAEKLTVVCAVEADIERACHQKFAHLRLNGEWFKPDVELLEFIEGLRSSGNYRESNGATGNSALPSVPSSLLRSSSPLGSSSISLETWQARSKPEQVDLLAEPALLTFPCDGEPNEWHLTESQVKAWSEAYPALDVIGEARKALVWVQASPNNTKTARGMGKFLVGWLGRAQNNNPMRGGGGTGPPARDVRHGFVRSEDCKHEVTGEVKL